MSDISIFEDEWRACLRAHYFHVIKERDAGNERSLITVLLQTGVTKDEISMWRAEALAELGRDSGPESASTDDTLTPTGASSVTDAGPEAPAAETRPESQPAAHEPAADSGRDEPDEPLVQLSLF